MPNLIGPLFSIRSSGTIAKTITFENSSRCKRARQRKVPTDPVTAAQTGRRTLFAYAVSVWQSLSTSDRQTWAAAANKSETTPYHAFLNAALNRWQQSQPPFHRPNDVPTTSGLTYSTITRTGGQGLVTLSSKPNTRTADEAIVVIIFRSLSTITAPSRLNCVAFVPVTPGVTFTYEDKPLGPGTYHYRTAYASATGGLGDFSPDGTAVVT